MSENYCLGLELFGVDIDSIGYPIDALVICKTMDDGVVHHRILTSEHLGSVEAAGMLLYAQAIIEYDFIPHCTHGDLDE